MRPILSVKRPPFPHCAKSVGTLEYDPYRANKKQPWWCIVDVDKDITAYYRWWLAKEKHIWLNLPSWDAHITVIRGERKCEQRQDLWKHLDKSPIEFTYEHGNVYQVKDPRQPGYMFFIKVHCPPLLEIRRSFGLSDAVNLHITIGRTYY